MQLANALLRWLPGLALALCLLPFAGSSWMFNDEFTLLADARRVVDGQVPYRDFFEFVPPVSIWAFALVVFLGGRHLAGAHILAAVIAWLIAWQATRILRRLGTGACSAWLLAFCFVLVCFARLPILSHHWLALPFELAAVELSCLAFARQERGPWLLAGCAVGLTGMCIQLDGAAVGIALAAALLLDGFRRGLPLAGVLRNLGALATGTAIVLGGIAAILAVQGALAQAWQDVVLWPIQAYRLPQGINDVAFATQLPSELGSPAAAIGWYLHTYMVLALYALAPAAALFALAWMARRPSWDERQAGLALLGLLAITSFWALTRGRADQEHLSIYVLPALMLATVAADRLARYRSPEAGLLPWMPLAALVLLLVAGTCTQLKAMRAVPEVWLRPFDDTRLARAPALDYLNQHARPGDRQAGLPLAGYFMFYGPPAGSPYTVVLPPAFGYGPGQYAAFWQQVARDRPRFIVLTPWPVGDVESPQAVAEHVRNLPPGYHLAARLPSRLWDGPTWPTWIYETTQAP